MNTRQCSNDTARSYRNRNYRNMDRNYRNWTGIIGTWTGITGTNNNNNNNTLFNEDLQIKLQLVQLVSNLVLLSSRNILHHVITILMQLTYFRYVGYTVTDASQTHNIHKYITITQH